MSKSYEEAGVSIDAGNNFVEQIKPFVASTKRTGVMGNIGGFAGFFQPQFADYQDPILVSGTDGVGTKLRLALELEKYDTIGIDLVAMCVNDIVCSGAEPLFFLDYLATGKLEPSIHAQVVKGVAAACKTVRCALLGGETAEMPDCYNGVDFDLAGFAVGIVDKQKIIDGTAVRPGQKIVGISSSGFHSNGYSLIRNIIKKHKLNLTENFEGKTLGEALLEPTALYSPLVHSLIKSFDVNAIAHITGGGFWDNLPRVFPKTIKAHIDKTSWEWPSLARHFQELGDISDEEMLRVFNCGIGLMTVINQNDVDDVLHHINAFESWVIGDIKVHDDDDPALTIE